MSVPDRTVWILGAGFSVPLGGGMLVELLSLKQRAAVDIRFPELGKTYEGQAQAVYTLYHAGAGFPEGHLTHPGVALGTRAKLWSNAEDFIDYLDAAARTEGGNGAQRKRLEQLWLAHWNAEKEAKRQSPFSHAVAKMGMPSCASLRDFARRVIAAECLLFTDDGVQETERWSPYRRWATELTNADTIVTFNYDLVLERLAKVENARISERSVFLGDSRTEDYLRSAKCATVLKLHGSANWTYDSEAKSLAISADEAALTCDAAAIAMATPGPTKPEMVKRAFTPMWIRARAALEHASAIVFLGYRFPPTDAEAREKLLRAIGDNRSPHLDVHIVLGPERSKDVVRLQRLLQHALESKDRTEYEPGQFGNYDGYDRSFSVHWEPLWAEDYLSVFAREALSKPPPNDWNEALPDSGSVLDR